MCIVVTFCASFCSINFFFSLSTPTSFQFGLYVRSLTLFLSHSFIWSIFSCLFFCCCCLCWLSFHHLVYGVNICKILPSGYRATGMNWYNEARLTSIAAAAAPTTTVTSLAAAVPRVHTTHRHTTKEKEIQIYKTEHNIHENYTLHWFIIKYIMIMPSALVRALLVLSCHIFISFCLSFLTSRIGYMFRRIVAFFFLFFCAPFNACFHRRLSFFLFLSRSCGSQFAETLARTHNQEQWLNVGKE